jgi:uncharacterized membrane protein
MNRKDVFAVWTFTLAAAVVWNAALFAAPALRLRLSWASGLIYAVFEPLCHQRPDRCFYLGGFPLAVCGRCLGVYLGFVAGLLIFPFQRGFVKTAPPPVPAFLIFSLPIGLDVAGNVLHLWTSPIGLRLATGAVWGTILPFYWMAGIVGAFEDLRTRRRDRSPASGRRRSGKDSSGA